MKKIFSYIGIFIGIAAIILSTSRDLFEKIENARSYDKHIHLWWGQQTGNWGDLAAMSYLDHISKFCVPKNYIFENPVDDGNKNIDLYLYGDSYVFEIPKESFANINAYYYLFRLGNHDCQLNRKKRNILIIEVSERFLRGKFKSTCLIDDIRISGYTHATKDANMPAKPLTHLLGINDLFNPCINQNLEYHLFNYNFLKFPRQLKATLNYKLFSRASGDVVISDSGDYLFFKPTVLSHNLASSYEVLGEKEIDTIVTSMNTIYEYYKEAGFAEIYFSIIPNAVTILQPQYYNQLIPRIQNNVRMKMPVIDIYTVFKNTKELSSLYRAGDSHWNNAGLQIWLRSVNDILRTESKK